MRTRTIRTVGLLFGLSLLLSACDAEDILQLIGAQPVDQAEAAADAGADAAGVDQQADRRTQSDTATHKQRATRRAPGSGDTGDNSSGGNGSGGDSSGTGAGGGGSANLSAVENEIFMTLNATRQEAGLRALALNADISVGAGEWSCEMAQSGNFRHADLRTAGVNGENIAFGQQSAAAVHDAWMNSPGHRDNRMNSRWTQYGVGVCKNSAGRMYFTERFR